MDQSTLVVKKSVPGFLLYPNPVSRSLTIQWESAPDADGKISYRIMDYSGRSVLSGILSENKIDVSHLGSGIYLIMLHTPNGAVTKTFLKQ